MTALAFRRAAMSDLPAIRAMHRRSFSALGASAYTSDEIAAFFAAVETADPQLVEDGTFFLAEAQGSIVATAAWTARRPAYEARLSATAPTDGPGTIRSVFTDPDHAGRGLAQTLMRQVEAEAIAAGVQRLELCATLSAVSFYGRQGYAPVAPVDLPLPGGLVFRACRMSKPVPAVRAQSAAA